MALEATDVWDALMALVKERAARYTLLEDYYKGEQALPIDGVSLNSRFGASFAAFRANMAKPIIEAAEGRVRIKDFGSGKGVSRDAMDAWKRNHMPVEGNWVHKEAMVKGDAFVIVLPDQDGSGGIYPQISESCAILYNDIYPRLKDAAIKWWIEDVLPIGGSSTKPYIRVNLYFEDRIERYISLSSGDVLESDWGRYEPYSDESTPFESPHQVGEVPMFQFSPNYLLSDGKGVSDLEDAMAILDLINKTFLDMAVASEFTAAPQRWATGVEIPLDPQTGEPKSSYKAGADNLWTAANDAAKFGQFTAGSLGAFKQGLDTMVESLAVISRTPMYYLMAQATWPSGEALKSTEGALRQRVMDHQDDFSLPWAQVMRAALKLDRITVEDSDLDELAPQWLPANAPFATREHLEELKVHVETLGVPEEMAWRQAGYTQAQIEEMKQMRQDQAALGLDVAAELQASAIVDAAVQTTAADTEGGLVADTAAPAPSPLPNA